MARCLLLLLVLVALQMVTFYHVEAAFELACMEKCFKTRRCKKYGQFTVDFDCDKQCKKKCYKIKT